MLERVTLICMTFENHMPGPGAGHVTKRLRLTQGPREACKQAEKYLGRGLDLLSQREASHSCHMFLEVLHKIMISY